MYLVDFFVDFFTRLLPFPGYSQSLLFVRFPSAKLLPEPIYIQII